jgi:chitinase
VRSLAAGATYSIEVRARDTRGDVSTAATVRVTTRADAGPPTTPENVRVVTSATGRPIGMAWDAATDDRGVGSYWLIADGGIVFNGGRDVDFFTLTDVECTLFSGETYTFTVRARDVSGNLSGSSTPVTVTVP